MKVFDLHNDVLTEVKNYKSEINNYPKNYKIVTAIYRGKRSFNNVKNLLSDYYKLKSKHTYIAFEDIGYKDLDLKALLSYNPLYVSLTHNGENALGYGVNYYKDLKPKGIETIKCLNEYGYTLDIAHLSKKATYSAINLANNVICSHTAFNKVYYNKRNLDDEVIRDIISKNGIIGLTFVGYFLSRKPANLYSVLEHIEYFLGKFSEDNLVIGSDFNGTDYLPKNLENYLGFENLYNLLLEKGYSKNVIEKILFKNAENYFFNNQKCLYNGKI